MAKHVMLDLETLSTRPNAAIVSIGAVVMDEDGSLGPEFYMRVDLENSAKFGHVDMKTLKWWLSQDDEARNELVEAGCDLDYSLKSFSSWMEDVDGTYVWGNGANFDNPILANAYDELQISKPWGFWNDRCFRTLKTMYPEVAPPARPTVAHNALDDAKSQALHLIEIQKVNNLSIL